MVSRPYGALWDNGCAASHRWRGGLTLCRPLRGLAGMIVTFTVEPRCPCGPLWRGRPGAMVCSRFYRSRKWVGASAVPRDGIAYTELNARPAY
jgi:hypothetical protein